MNDTHGRPAAHESHGGGRYDGYRSFSYLEPGTDYRSYELAAQVDRVKPDPVPLSPEEEERMERLANRYPLVSFHEHAGLFPARVEETPDYLRQGRMATAFAGLAASRWDVVFDGLMNGLCRIHSHTGWHWEDVIHDLGMRLCDLAHQDFVVPIRRVEEIREAREAGRVGWVACLEGAAMIENELDRIEILYGLGVRVLGVTYSEANALGSGLKERRDGGLTSFGRKAVERMNRVGMLVDCSHAGDRTTLDTVEVSEAPVVLTHIGARALRDSKRLAPDRVLEAVAESGGVIGIEAAPLTTVVDGADGHDIESVMAHLRHVVELVGVDHVAIGADTIYGDHLGIHRLYAQELSLAEAKGSSDRGSAGVPEDHGDFAFVRGMENPTEVSDNALRWLVREGYSNEEIGKVMGGNIIRVLEEVWA